MLNVLLALRVWGSKLANKIVRLWCDNRAVVDIMTRRKTKDKHLGEILREVLMLQATYNINLEVCHIAGKNNDIADALSRVHMDKCSECCTYLLAKGCKRMNVSESDLIVDQNHLWYINKGDIVLQGTQGTRICQEHWPEPPQRTGQKLLETITDSLNFSCVSLYVQEQNKYCQSQT